MESEKENFLDKNSILAIVILVFAWIGWDAYMKKKYPPPEKPTPQQTQTERKEDLKAAKIVKESAVAPTPIEIEEQIFRFSGKEADFFVSSRGMGLKKVTLKKFFSRNREAIVFESGDWPLFATGFLNGNAPIPFQVEQKGRILKGRFFHQGTEIIKTLEIRDFVLKVSMEVKKQGEGFLGLSHHFQIQKREAQKGDEESNFWSQLSQKVFFQLPDNITGFVSSVKDSVHLMGKKHEETHAYTEVFAAAVGTKYFGGAFVNQSPLLPEARFRGQERSFQAEVIYKPLNKKNFAYDYKLFLGPKSLNELEKLDPKTKEWINFGFFAWLARPILKMLVVFKTWFGNWGFAIVFLTFFIRLCLLPVNIKSYKSMKVMKDLQPEIQALREKYKTDKQKQSQEQLALMRKHKANPIGGCLPAFLQLPVFFALYRVLGESVELYQAPFVLWVKDLSLKDPYYVLPILGAATLFVQQRLTPVNLPPAQARIFTFMPVIFSVFLLGLPSGLTLYIFVTTLFGLIQQYFFVKLQDKT